MSANFEMRVSEDDLRAVAAMIRASGEFDPREHPRYPKGFPQGGRFAPKPSPAEHRENQKPGRPPVTKDRPQKVKKIIQKAIDLDPALVGFQPDRLPEAARYRLARLARRGRFDGKLETDEIEALQSLHSDPVERYDEKPEGQDPWSYLVFEDGSLYYANNAQDEVWESSRDFIVERLLNDAGREPDDYPPDSAEGRLIKAYL
jgi:hypothetical protein